MKLEEIEDRFGVYDRSKKQDPRIKQYADDNNLDYTKAERILKARGYKGK